MSASRFLRAALFAAALWTGPAIASQSIDVATYVDSPDGDYHNFDVLDTFSAGVDDADPGPLTIDSANYTAAFFGPLDVASNGITARWGTSRGGFLNVTGDFSVVSEAGASLFFVNTANNRVGIGTAAPARTLDVRGVAKARTLTAYMDTFDWYQPYGEMWSENNGVARFSASYYDITGTPQRSRYCTLHIDGNPLTLQTLIKGGMEMQGLGRGQVVVKGENGGFPTPDAKVILVVGEPFASVGPPGYYPDTATPPEAYAHEWYQYSSRDYKKDIVPLGAGEYPAMLRTLSETPVVYFRYKQEPPRARPHLGLVAEEAPSDIVDASGKAIGLGEEAAYLLAAARAVQNDMAALRARVEKARES